jgi:putative ABC transport system ATP-binding protein
LALGTAEISQIGEKMRPVPFKDGEVLIRQGEVGDRFYLLRKGEVDVRVSDGSGDRLVATMGLGAYFGEKAILTGEVRNATVVGKGPGLAYTLGKEEFQEALRSTPTFKDQLQKGYFGR